MLDPAAKRQINCGRLSTPAIYGKYPGSENGDWKDTAPQPGRAVKDCFFNDSNAFLVEHLDSNFTIICRDDSLDQAEKDKLAAHGIKILEIDPNRSSEFITLYELTARSFYLVGPDQYILGRWKNFTPQDAITLMNRYLSGEVFPHGDLQKTAQELVDQQVYAMIMKG